MTSKNDDASDPFNDPRGFLTDLFHVAVNAADPHVVLKNYLPEKPKGRTIVVGAGKASAHMAQAMLADWDSEVSGAIVTRGASAVDCGPLEIIEAAHPVPDEGSERGAKRLLECVSGLNEDDLVVALISGGGSSLLSLPPEAIPSTDKRALNDILLKSGASIDEMNCIRKHVSQIKGGRLAAAAHPAKVVSLVISDIPGDDPALVASGPTVPSETTIDDALAIIARYEMKLPASISVWLKSDECAAPMPDDAVFANNEVHIIAAAQMSLDAAAQMARAEGVETYILSDCIEGEASDVGGVHAALAKQVKHKSQPFKAPCLILSGGETTVTIRAKGKGGRNTEFLLASAIALAGEDGITALAADTDGIDGTEDNAGAFANGTSIAEMRMEGIKAKEFLAGNDAYSAFAAIDAIFAPGATKTNVNDFRAILIS